MKSLLLFLVVVCSFVSLCFNKATEKNDHAIFMSPYQSSIAKSSYVKDENRKGMYVPAAKRWIREPRLRKMLLGTGRKDNMILYGMKKVKDFTASAPGTDGRHHFVNSYLVDYAPFRTSNIWIPWQVLAKKKVYELDSRLYGGKRDVWQTSKQAYRFTRGDCEDHAIALADWLISMGEDARVVIGTWNGGGHAWVVLLKGKKQYLLEATQKKGVRGVKRFPLAKHKRGYNPEFMFNRRLFWKNEGSSFTSNYKSSKWQLKSHYTLGTAI